MADPYQSSGNQQPAGNGGAGSPLLASLGAKIAVVVAVLLVVIGLMKALAPEPASRKKVADTNPAATTNEETAEERRERRRNTNATRANVGGGSARPTPAVGQRPNAGPYTINVDAGQRGSGFKRAQEILDSIDTESTNTAKTIGDLTALLRTETDPDVRIELAGALGEVEDPAAIRQILSMLQTEKDEDVRDALLDSLSVSDASPAMAKEIMDALRSMYQRATDEDMRTQIQDVAGDIDSKESVEFLSNLYQDQKTAILERVNAAENIIRISVSEPGLVTPAQVQAVTERLRTEAANATDVEVRTQAVIALTNRKVENREFLQGLLRTETNDAIKRIINQSLF